MAACGVVRRINFHIVGHRWSRRTQHGDSPIPYPERPVETGQGRLGQTVPGRATFHAISGVRASWQVTQDMLYQWLVDESAGCSRGTVTNSGKILDLMRVFTRRSQSRRYGATRNRWAASVAQFVAFTDTTELRGLFFQKGRLENTADLWATRYRWASFGILVRWKIRRGQAPEAPFSPSTHRRISFLRRHDRPRHLPDLLSVFCCLEAAPVVDGCPPSRHQTTLTHPHRSSGLGERSDGLPTRACASHGECRADICANAAQRRSETGARSGPG
jgi:hypothetical protein